MSSKSSIRSSAYAGSSTSAIFASMSALERSKAGTYMVAKPSSNDVVGSVRDCGGTMSIMLGAGVEHRLEVADS